MPAFVREFYYEEVQTLLYSNETPLQPRYTDVPAPTTTNTHTDTNTNTNNTTSSDSVVFDTTTGQAQLTFFEKLWVYLKRTSSKLGSARYEESEVVQVAEMVVGGQVLGELHASGPPALSDNPTGA